MMRRYIYVFLVILLCAMLPVGALAAEGEQSASKSGPVGFEGYTEVTAPVLYNEDAPEEETTYTFDAEPVKAPALYEDGMGTGTLVVVIVAAVAVAAAVAFFLLRKKK